MTNASYNLGVIVGFINKKTSISLVYRKDFYLCVFLFSFVICLGYKRIVSCNFQVWNIYISIKLIRISNGNLRIFKSIFRNSLLLMDYRCEFKQTKQKTISRIIYQLWLIAQIPIKRKLINNNCNLMNITLHKKYNCKSKLTC